MTLRIESVNGSPINEYRIQRGHVEMRSLTASGNPFPGESSRWRVLDDNDIQLHHALGTVVSHWLCVRLGAEPAVLKRAA